jgi:predicted transcriptional regulator
VTNHGSYVDGIQVSKVTLQDLTLKPGDPIPVRIGIKETALNIGGLNLFGSKFGNYPQDIVLRQHFKRAPRYLTRRRCAFCVLANINNAQRQ